MKKQLLWTSLTMTLVLVGCGGGGGSSTSTIPTTPAPAAAEDAVNAPEPIELTVSDSPIELQGAQASFAQDISYGPDERNVFDIFLPDASAPTPLIIYIHGGGFTGGSKESIYGGGANDIARYLNAGAAFASSTYRLLQDVDADGVGKPLNDSKRALQFIRYHAAQLNIDPARIAIYGGSAGAGTALWLASSDDMAEPDAEDPVLRQSTRIAGAGAIETQATYDLLRWISDVFIDFGITFDLIFGAQPELEQRLFSFC